jgi:hypothetical protein
MSASMRGAHDAVAAVPVRARAEPHTTSLACGFTADIADAAVLLLIDGGVSGVK